MAKTKVERIRNFAFEIYPDEHPDYIELIDSLHVPAFAILHDNDINPDGTFKAAHVHVVLMYDSPKTRDQARSDAHLCGAKNDFIQDVKTLRGMSRYLCHLDNPEKFQYDVSEVKCFAGADYMSAIDLPTDKYSIIAQMIDFCMAEHIFSYHNLLIYAKDNCPPWYRSLCDNSTMVIKEFLKSFRWSIDNPDKQ